MQTSPTTLSQLLASVTVLKVSGYNQSVEGHGRQQVMFGASSVQIRPGKSGEASLAESNERWQKTQDSQPVVILAYSSSWRKGIKQEPRKAASSVAL